MTGLRRQFFGLKRRTVVRHDHWRSSPIASAVVLAFGISLRVVVSPVHGQSSFQNLGFEAATFVPIPNDRYQRVYPDSALPGWIGSVGTNQLNAVLHDDLFLDSSGIAIFDSSWPPGYFAIPGPLQGNFSVLLQAGLDLASGTPGDVSLTQTGLVPFNAKSLWFRATQVATPPQFAVSLGGENLGLVVFPPDGNLGNLYGADISSLAGETLPLTFTVFAQRPYLSEQHNLYLDAIAFSPTQLPEPSTLGLFALAIGLAGGYRLNRKRRLTRESSRPKGPKAVDHRE